MRRVLASLFTLLFFTASAGAGSLEGNWETVIASPRRPWIFDTRFERTGAGWSGTLTMRGFGTLPISAVWTDLERVRFVFPPELDSVVFEGVFTDSGIVGHVEEEGETTSTRLFRVEPLPEPLNRVEAWRQDLDYAARHMSAYDRSFSPPARAEFQRAVAKLESDLATENDAQILTGLARAVALAGNAHTRLRLDPTTHGTFSTEFPLALWWFHDGPYVVRAAAPYERALRCRLVAIDGRAIGEARRTVSQLFAGNASWSDYLSPIYLMNPDVLFGLGIAHEPRQAKLTLEDQGGRRFDLLVRAVARDKARHESWQKLTPAIPMGSPRWASALPDSAGLPLYLRHPDRSYWFDYAPETGLLYFQFNHSDDDSQAPPFQKFADSLVAFVRAHDVKDVVIDLRLNGGGNLDVAKPFMKSLAEESSINRAGHLFVITGTCTFSAAIYHSAQLRQYTRATFVGEPVGDRLDFWAEGGEIVLPRSAAAINYSNGFHRYSGRDYPENKPYYEALKVASLDPDIPAPLTSTDYFARRDPALAAIAARLAGSASATSPRSSP